MTTADPASTDTLKAAPITTQSWTDTLKSFLHPRVVTMLFLGFSAGIPILLIFSSLSLWLTEAGVEKSAVTFFSWAALGYSFKFVWAPLVDRLPLPVLTKWLGRRRGWLLLSQLAVIGALFWMALTNPGAGVSSLTIMAFAAVALGFSSATQDIVIDAYRIDSAGDELQALMSSTYIAGYRIGMIVAGAGALYLAQYFGSTKDIYNYEAWRNTYLAMGAVMLVGIATTLVIKEPDNRSHEESTHRVEDHVRFFLAFLISVIAFIMVFRFSSGIVSTASSYLTELFNNRHLAGLIVSTSRLFVAVAVVLGIVQLLNKTKAVNGKMIRAAYMEPIKGLFQSLRYELGGTSITTYRFLSSIGYCPRCYRQCLLSGHGLLQGTNRQCIKGIRSVDDNNRWFSGRTVCRAFWRHAHPSSWCGVVSRYQPAVYPAG